MKKIYLAAVIGVLSSNTALAQMATSLTIENTTSQTITQLHFAPILIPEWGDNRLGAAMIPPGGKHFFPMRAFIFQDCAVNVKIVFSKEVSRFLKTDMCRHPTVTVEDGGEEADGKPIFTAKIAYAMEMSEMPEGYSQYLPSDLKN